MTQQFKALAVLPKDCIRFPAPTWWLIRMGISSSRGSVALFWLPRAPGAQSCIQSKHSSHIN